MVLLGIIFVFGGGQLVWHAFRRRKLSGPDVWGKTDHNEPLSIMGCIIYVVFGLTVIALGLNYVIRYR
jgi:hypothetical protein